MIRSMRGKFLGWGPVKAPVTIASSVLANTKWNGQGSSVRGRRRRRRRRGSCCWQTKNRKSRSGGDSVCACCSDTTPPKRSNGLDFRPWTQCGEACVASRRALLFPRPCTSVPINTHLTEPVHTDAGRHAVRRCAFRGEFTCQRTHSGCARRCQPLCFRERKIPRPESGAGWENGGRIEAELDRGIRNRIIRLKRRDRDRERERD